VARLPPLSFAELSAEQQKILQGLGSANRAQLVGPNSVLVRLPEVCASFRDLAVRLRYDSRVEDRLFELMVLTVARDWSSQYEWFAHEPGARAAGISAAVIEAIRERRPPPFERDDERLVFEFVSELQQARRINDATYARAEAALGLETLIELVAAIGFYNFTAVVLNAFDVAVPGARPPLDEPA